MKALACVLAGMLALAAQPACAQNNRQGWSDLTQRLLAFPLAQRPEMINRVVNDDFDYHPDPAVWQTPEQFAARGAGDCKDFAFTKYWLLAQAGVSKNRLRMAYTRWTSDTGTVPHMVLLMWNDSGSPFVFDNLVPHIQRLADRRDLTVVFSFDEHHFFDADGAQVIRDKPLKGWAALRPIIAAVEAAPVAMAAAEPGRFVKLRHRARVE